MAADRAQHVAAVIEPALARGEWVVSDRFVPSSLVYQGVVRGLGVDVVEQLNAVATRGSCPTSCSCSTSTTPSRGARRRGEPDRLEREGDRRSTPRCARAYRDLAPRARLDRGRRRRRGRRGRGTRPATPSRRSWQDDQRHGGEPSTGTGSSGQDRAVALLQRAADAPGARVPARRAARLGRRGGGALLRRRARSRPTTTSARWTSRCAACTPTSSRSTRRPRRSGSRTRRPSSTRRTAARSRASAR